MSKSRRRLLISIGAGLVLVPVLLMMVPFLFEDRIAERARVQIEKAVDARVEWADVDLSLLRHFPHLTLSLEDLEIRGTGVFEADTLARVPGFRLVLDLGSVLFGDQIVLRSIDLDGPAVHLIVLEDGAANWDIARADAGRADPAVANDAGLNVGLRSVTIDDASIVFDNRRSGLSASVRGLDHTLEGDFTRDRFEIRTRTQAPEVTLRSGPVTLLAGVPLDAVADVAADMTTRTFTFGDNRISLADLDLAFTGGMTAGEAGTDVDLEFESTRTDFASVLSLVSALRGDDFESLVTEGRVAVGGRINGRFGEGSFPMIAAHVTVDSAMFRYPQLPQAARDIFVDIAVNNPGGSADSTVIRVERFRALIGNDPIAATMTVRTPVSDPAFDVDVDGVLDLEAAGRTFALDDIEELAGRVTADFSVRARKSDVVAERYDRVAASGDIAATGVVVQSASLPHRVAIDDFSLGISPQAARLRSLRGTVGSSDVRLEGSLDNLLGYLLADGDLGGTASFASQRFDLTEWQSDRDSLTVIPVPPRIDFALSTDIAELHHGRLDMTDVSGRVRVRDRRLTLDDLRLNAVGGEFRVSGYYETVDPDRPAFDVDVAITDADVASSFEALTTVRLLAPVARYAQGRYSTSLHLNGILGQDMTPVLDALSGQGSLRTTQVALQNFPPLERLAEALNSQRLQNPALRAISTAIDIRDGRLHVRPFDVGVGETTLTVGGSNGIDRTLDYNLVLALPQSSLEAGARQAVGNLLSRAGLDPALDSMSIIRIGARLTGTIDNPDIRLEAGRGVADAVQSLEQAAKESVDRAAEAARARADSARADAMRRAEAEAQELIDAAERQAAVIREEAAGLAETVRREAAERADSLVARAGSVVARAAAQQVANRLRSEADERALQITTEADRRADSLVTEARERAQAIRSRAADPDTTTAPRAGPPGTDTTTVRPGGA